jgi:hypothetical protein
MKTLAALALAVAGLLPSLPAQAAATSLLVNGSFETLPTALPNGTWTVLPSLAGWTVDAGSGLEVRNNVAGQAQDGLVFVELDTHSGGFNGSVFDGSTNSWIAQTVATAVGQHYTLTWFYAPRQGAAGDTTPIEVLWNGSPVAKSVGSGMGAGAGVWVQYTLDLIGTGSDTLKFVAGGKQDSVGGSLDNVSLVAAASRATAASNPVPEPGSAVLVLVALAGLGLARRRRA